MIQVSSEVVPARPAVEIHWNSAKQAYELTTEVYLPQSRDRVFDFFSDAFQLERITPHWLNFQILTPAPVHIRQGCLIDYRIRLHGIPISWQTEISTWDPPFSFTDRQVRGPYRLWEHFHTFEEYDGGTAVRDRVFYRVPGGALANRLFVQGDLLRIFLFRGEQLQQIFAQAPECAGGTA